MLNLRSIITTILFYKLGGMENREVKRFVEIILFILNKTGGIDAYHLYKILYFAELKLLGRQGASLVPDTFLAMENGPVPKNLYHALKASETDDNPLTVSLHKLLVKGTEDAQNILLANLSVYPDTLTGDEQWALESSIKENALLSFSELREKSHDEAWKATNRNHEITRLAMARVATSDPGMISYIEETENIERRENRTKMHRSRRSHEASTMAQAFLKATSAHGISPMKKWL